MEFRWLFSFKIFVRITVIYLLFFSLMSFIDNLNVRAHHIQLTALFLNPSVSIWSSCSSIIIFPFLLLFSFSIFCYLPSSLSPHIHLVSLLCISFFALSSPPFLFPIHPQYPHILLPPSYFPFPLSSISSFPTFLFLNIHLPIPHSFFSS